MDYQGIALVIAALGAVISPLLMSWLSNRHRREEKLEDYARQDEVARKADVATGKVAEAARLLLESNARVAKRAEVTDGKLDQIHVLVNSTLSAAKVSELNAFIALLALMQDPASFDPDQIEPTQKKIVELKALVRERAEQTVLADKQR